MSPGRFCFVLTLLASALGSALFYHGALWRGLGFPVAGLFVCLLFSVKHFMNYFKSDDLVGTALQTGEITSTPKAPGYFFAGRSLSFEEACHHFVVAGATGSGKSITINLLMESVLTKLGSHDRTPAGKPIKRRVLLYDAKADLVPLVAGLCGGMERVKILNPLDSPRFTPWDIAADILTQTDADEFATMLIPKNEKDSSPYFGNTARALVAGVIKRFIVTRVRWKLRDVLNAFDSKAQLQAILNHPETRNLKDHFSKDNAKNFAGVKSTLDTELSIYRPVAALLESALKEGKEAISLNDWVAHQETVLVLGNHEKAREATDTLNRLMFHHLSKELISREGVLDDGSDETWIFLDECREAGVLRGLRQLLLRGRSKAVAVVLGFQDVEGMYAAYGDHEGAEIIGAAHNIAMLHINPSAPNTARWCSDVCSSRRDEVRTTSNTMGDKGASHGMNTAAQLVPNVYPIQFVELPLPTPETDFHFYSFTNADGYRYFTYPWRNGFLEKEGFFRYIDAEAYPPFRLNTDPQAYSLSPWEPNDYTRLGITPVSAEQKDGTESAALDATLLLEDSAPPPVH